MAGLNGDEQAGSSDCADGSGVTGALEVRLPVNLLSWLGELSPATVSVQGALALLPHIQSQSPVLSDGRLRRLSPSVGRGRPFVARRAAALLLARLSQDTGLLRRGSTVQTGSIPAKRASKVRVP